MSGQAGAGMWVGVDPNAVQTERDHHGVLATAREPMGWHDALCGARVALLLHGRTAQPYGRLAGDPIPWDIALSTACPCCLEVALIAERASRAGAAETPRPADH
ncbi:hypothetical protein ACFWY5_56985 [Nonomuraea sp. NPDC059007]|uniref:hypothetical protein n=1 Tax=Nonomuraea sp. NPDC059007 TaxID=3346692 RepID=UPI0036AF3F79